MAFGRKAGNFSIGKKKSRMLFGHNSNVALGTETVHVQTEDRGTTSAVIDTTVHWKGRVLHRRTSKYLDLLPLDPEKEAALKVRLDEQHRSVVNDIRSGALQLALHLPAPVPLTAVAPPRVTPGALKVLPGGLRVELTNPKTWLAGKNATLELAVKNSAGDAIAGAETKARIEGADGLPEFIAKTDDSGLATLQFEMPRLAGTEAALVIDAAHNGAKGQLRFQLRAKPKA